MLTACWQQAMAIPGQHFNGRGFVHDDFVNLAAQPIRRVQAGLERLIP
jgi:hypothetical protein